MVVEIARADFALKLLFLTFSTPKPMLGSKNFISITPPPKLGQTRFWVSEKVFLGPSNWEKLIFSIIPNPKKL